MFVEIIGGVCWNELNFENFSLLFHFARMLFFFYKILFFCLWKQYVNIWKVQKSINRKGKLIHNHHLETITLITPLIAHFTSMQLFNCLRMEVLRPVHVFLNLDPSHTMYSPSIWLTRSLCQWALLHINSTMQANVLVDDYGALQVSEVLPPKSQIQRTLLFKWPQKTSPLISPPLHSLVCIW